MKKSRKRRLWGAGLALALCAAFLPVAIAASGEPEPGGESGVGTDATKTGFSVSGKTEHYNTFCEALYAASGMSSEGPEGEGEEARGLERTEDGAAEPLTFTLQADIEGAVVEEDKGFTGFTIEKGETIVLDLNGHSIEVEDKVPENKTFILFQNLGTFTIKDSSANGSGSVKIHNMKGWDNAAATVLVRSGGWSSGPQSSTLYIQGGTLTVESDDYIEGEGRYIANMAYVVDAFDGAQVTMSGGTLQSDYDTIRLYVQTVTGDINFTMTDGVLKEGENRYTGLIQAQNPDYGRDEEKIEAFIKSEDKDITINIQGGELICPNEAIIYFNHNFLDDNLDVFITGDTKIHSPGPISDILYYYDPKAAGTVDNPQYYPIATLEIGAEVQIDPRYVTRYRGEADLIDPEAMGVKTEFAHETYGLMMSTKTTYDEYYNNGTTAYPNYYYNNDICFVKPAEEDQPEEGFPDVYVFLQITQGEWNRLTDAQRLYLTEVLGLKVNNGTNQWYTIGTLEGVAIPAPSDDKHEGNYYTSYATAIEQALPDIVPHNGVNGAAELVQMMEWTRLHTDRGVADMGDVSPEEYCWHLNGKLDLDALKEPELIIQPADITIYTGGEGYGGASGAAEGHGLPEPGFHITLPVGVQEWLEKESSEGESGALDLSELLTFRYSKPDGGSDSGSGSAVTRSWELVYEGVYSTAEDGTPLQYVYSLKAGKGAPEDQPPVSIVYFKDEDGDGVWDKEHEEQLISDAIGMTAQAPSQDYAMAINPGELDPECITAELTVGDDDTLTFQVTAGSGTLTVRGTVAEDPVTCEIAETADEAEEGAITAAADTSVTYYVNESGVAIEDKDRVQLLVDEVSGDAGFNAEMGKDAIDHVVSEMADTGLAYPGCELAYLNLVDVGNGNAVVTLGEGSTLTIRWPMPEDADPNGQFYVVHYADMDRENPVGDVSQSDKYMEEVTVSEDGGYLTFTVKTFSPFALVYERIPPYIPPVVNPDPEEPKPDPTPDYVPEGLNTEDHYAYLIGNGGLIRPEDDITRAEVAAIFFRLLTDETRQAYWSIQSGFTDVSEGNWFNTAVSTLTNLGVLHGYQDGSFQPNAPISRAEFTAIATRFFDYTAEYEDGTFPDVHESNWYADEVQAAVDMGLIQGYPTGVFAPGDSITRGEACAIVNRVLNRRPHEEHLLDREEMNTWPDNTGDRWFYEDVQEASNTHDYDWILEDGQTVEEWTAKLPDPDWAAIEYGG